MSRIRSKHTKSELIIRSLLHRSGFRFRVNYKSLPGSPDIVLPKYRTVILVHGCFWHRHPGCQKATTPNTNKRYWQEKFRKNVSRDVQNKEKLEALNWKVIVVWECEIFNDPLAVLDAIRKKLNSDFEHEEHENMDRGEILKAAEKKQKYFLNKKEN